jgi:hypothetical protein
VKKRRNRRKEGATNTAGEDHRTLALGGASGTQRDLAKVTRHKRKPKSPARMKGKGGDSRGARCSTARDAVNDEAMWDNNESTRALGDVKDENTRKGARGGDEKDKNMRH